MNKVIKALEPQRSEWRERKRREKGMEQSEEVRQFIDVLFRVSPLRNSWFDPDLSDLDYPTNIVFGKVAERVVDKVRALEAELRHRSTWHHPACRKLMYDIGSSPCTCESEFNYTVEALGKERDELKAENAALKIQLEETTGQ